MALDMTLLYLMTRHRGLQGLSAMRIFLRSRGNPDSRKEVIISPKMVKDWRLKNHRENTIDVSKCRSVTLWVNIETSFIDDLALKTGDFPQVCLLIRGYVVFKWLVAVRIAHEVLFRDGSLSLWNPTSHKPS